MPSTVHIFPQADIPSTNGAKKMFLESLLVSNIVPSKDDGIARKRFQDYLSSIH